MRGKSKATYRQLWINGTEQACRHTRLAEVMSAGGDVLAERCEACGLVVATHARCAGCGKHKRLTFYVAARGRRYCTEDCYAAKVKAERQAKAERAASKGV